MKRPYPNRSVGRLLGFAAGALILLAATVAGAQESHRNIDILDRLYGIPSPPSVITTNPSVGTSAAQILNQDPASIEVIVVDLSTNSCEVAFDNLVSTTRGVQLAASGGFMSVNVRDDGPLPTNQFWAVCAGAASSLYVVRLDLQ